MAAGSRVQTWQHVLMLAVGAVLAGCTACSREPSELAPPTDASTDVLADVFDAGPPPLVPQTPDCVKRSEFHQRAPDNLNVSLWESIPDGTPDPPLPREFHGGPVQLWGLDKPYPSSGVRGTTSFGEAGLGMELAPGWTAADLTNQVLYYYRARELLSCDHFRGNPEPVAAYMRRLDDAHGKFLFLGGQATGLWRSGEVARPSAVPYPPGLSIRWEPAVDTCHIGFGEGVPLSAGYLVVTTPTGEIRLMSGEQGEFTFNGEVYRLLVGVLDGPPPTGNFCGTTFFKIFKKGLFYERP